MNLNNLFPFFLLLIMFSACAEEEAKEPAYDKQHLIGKWELTEAWRKGKKTEMLTGIYYEFDETGDMRTNFTPNMQESEFTYGFDGNHIIQKGEKESVYVIDSLTNSTLIFSTIFINYPFKLAFNKHIAKESG